MILLSQTYRTFWTVSKECYLKQIRYSLGKSRIRLYSTEIEAVPKKTVRSMIKKKQTKTSEMPFIAWPLLVFPVAAFGLGTWQVQRKSWKEGLLAELKKRTELQPTDIPKDLSELENMEYHPVRVRGKFHHDKELYLGPRSMIVDNRAQPSGSALFSRSNTGYLVITPFTLSDRNLTILVNRGWVPADKKLPNTRKEGQITDEVEFVGIIRHSAQREPLGMKNIPESNFWTYFDLEKMSQVTGAAPILIDADLNSSMPGGPIGGQTMIGLRNEHLSYIVTWYALSITTGWMWFERYWKYIKK